ncbi:uncharacterized protein FIBRA_01946 [Fibroporia radiculosa]|uniref:AB hydrolase-1 domain-containing protein n=1 Tax=Fibroporia radiculosa TaxID=599839 RepID=J4I8S5_9APHY|nr:uncharacterized protein FIBRA_01946 [Fibroporia radiculosa]CCL99921.1 predicted protein [Fibroporia radiculosa]
MPVLRPRKLKPETAPTSTAGPSQSLRPRKHLSKIPGGIPDINKRSRRRKGDETFSPVMYPSPRIPLELWTMVFRELEKYSDLANASRLCRILQAEAESVLYREVVLERVPHVRRFARALASNPHRANAVRVLYMFDNGHFKNVPDIINRILESVKNLKHLQIYVHFDQEESLLSDLHEQLKKCTFELQRFGSNLDFLPDLFEFLAGQPGIERLSSKPGSWCESKAEMPAEFLPRLKILSANMTAMPVFVHARNVTHLDIFLSDQDTVDRALRIFGDQLVSLKLTRLVELRSQAFPIDLFRNVVAPVRYLEIADLTLMVPYVAPSQTIDYSYINQPGVKLQRFIWMPDWVHPHHTDSPFMTIEERQAAARRFAQGILEACKDSIQEFIYLQDCHSYIQCSLDENGQLVETERPEATIEKCTSRKFSKAKDNPFVTLVNSRDRSTMSSSTFFKAGDGSSLHYETSLPPASATSSKPTLVLLHYWGGSIRTWHKVIAPLKSTYPILAVDLPGWGASSLPGGEDVKLTIASTAKSIMTLLMSLPYEFSALGFVLTGHSMGSKVCMALLEAAHDAGQPLTIRGMVLIAPAPPSPLVLPLEMREQQKHAYDSPESAEWTVSNVLARRENLSDEELALIVGDSVRAAKVAKEAWPLYGMAECIDVPQGSAMDVVVLAGAMDIVETKERVKAEVVDVLLNKGYVVKFRLVENVKHLIPLEDPEAIVNDIRTYF